MSMDLKSVWEAMEECQRIGLTRSIGVSNFSQHMLEKLLLTATVPPAVNQVEMNVAWQQSSLREYCKEKGIHVTAYSPLGGSGGPLAGNQMLGTELIRKMAKSRGKTAAQACIGVSLVVKSLRKEMLKENLQIFGWELCDDECKIISQFPPHKRLNLNKMLSVEGKLSLDLSDYEFP
ncbi:hypothetical protein HPP92_004384 [Vanilla planifolia]|uniref:NADP-dependent oxidoreductase domain-containing protein n=1 Tax=Vanilla planifolia TaxID=51239 RepID=A0A835RZC4_VANPL|nr:hypothetical protein HPP92_004384 [Vanilla planifolia]